MQFEKVWNQTRAEQHGLATLRYGWVAQDARIAQRGGAMGDGRKAIEDISSACQQARAALNGSGSLRTTVLLDMLLIELRKDLQRLTAQTPDRDAQQG